MPNFSMRDMLSNWREFRGGQSIWQSGNCISEEERGISRQSPAPQSRQMLRGGTRRKDKQQQLQVTARGSMARHEEEWQYSQRPNPKARLNVPGAMQSSAQHFPEEVRSWSSLEPEVRPELLSSPILRKNQSGQHLHQRGKGLPEEPHARSKFAISSRFFFPCT